MITRQILLEDIKDRTRKTFAFNLIAGRKIYLPIHRTVATIKQVFEADYGRYIKIHFEELSHPIYLRNNTSVEVLEEEN